MSPALAQTPVEPAPASGGTFDGVLQVLHLKSKPTATPAFVTKTRPDDDHLNYIPVGGQHPQRSDKVLSPDEIAAATANLDAARMAQQRRAGVKPVPVPTRSAKGPKKAKTADQTIR